MRDEPIATHPSHFLLVGDLDDLFDLAVGLGEGGDRGKRRIEHAQLGDLDDLGKLLAALTTVLAMRNETTHAAARRGSTDFEESVDGFGRRSRLLNNRQSLDATDVGMIVETDGLGEVENSPLLGFGGLARAGGSTLGASFAKRFLHALHRVLVVQKRTKSVHHRRAFRQGSLESGDLLVLGGSVGLGFHGVSP